MLRREPVESEMFRKASVGELMNCLLSYEKEEEVVLQNLQKKDVS